MNETKISIECPSTPNKDSYVQHQVLEEVESGTLLSCSQLCAFLKKGQKFQWKILMSNIKFLKRSNQVLYSLAANCVHFWKKGKNSSDDVPSELVYIGCDFGDHYYDNFKIIPDYNSL
jgi:hypothetical protein